jgi:nucleoside triphosphatase
MNNKQFPKAVVGVMVYNDKGEIFLAKCKKWDDKWVVPGGHVEWGETLVECARREVKEETNLEVTDIELFNVQESIFSEEYHEKKHMVLLDYSCKATSNDVQLNDEIQEYVWIRPEEALEKLDIGKSAIEFINHFINKKII